MIEQLAEEVHVWVAGIETDFAEGGRCMLLSDHERDRRRRLGEPARLQFVLSRAVLRSVLAQYWPEEPKDIPLSTGCAHCGDPSHGKPALEIPPESRPFSFSLSRTHGRVLVAVARHEVGVDVERVDQDFDVQRAAPLVLGDGDRPVCGVHAFYALWTSKEAYLKGLGLGLVREPCSISFLPDQRTGWPRR